MENAQKLQELGLSTTEELAELVSLTDILAGSAASWTTLRLCTVANQVQQRANELSHMPSKPSSSELADTLRRDNDVNAFEEMIDQLARAGRDEEVFLLVNASTTAIKTNALTFSEPSICSLLNGLRLLAKPAEDAILLNLLFSTLFTGWQAESLLAKIRCGVALLRAHIVGPFAMPKDMLWLTFQDWPDPYMPTWCRLWTLFMEEQPFTVQSEDLVRERRNAVQNSRQFAEQFLSQEKGQYVKAGRVSKRHAKVLNSVLLPWYRRKLEDLVSLENKLLADDDEINSNAIDRILEKCKQCVIDLSEEAAYQRYESAILNGEIDDNHPYHRNTALHVALDCAESIRRYAKAISEYAIGALDQPNRFSLEILQLELQQKFTHDIIAADLRVDMLASDTAVAHELRTDDVAQLRGTAIVEKEFLSESRLVRRLPRTTAYLSAKHVDWQELWWQLLCDIAEPPMCLAEVAQTLLKLEAPNQVLYFADEIGAEHLQQAQQLDTQLGRRTSALYADLLEAGGQYPTWQDEVQTGRWKLLLENLNAKLEERRELRRYAEEFHQLRVSETFLRIQDLVSLLFQERSKMPLGSYDNALRGLQQAQLAISSSEPANEALFAAVNSYCEQLIYQFDHNTWPVDKISSLAAQLNDALTQSSDQTDTMDTAKVLELLEHRNLVALGLNPSTFDESKVETRTELLHQWERLLGVKRVLFDELATVERTTLQKLMQKFALMTQLKQVFGQDNKHIVVTQTVLYGVYRLTLPKSPSLNRDCVVLMIPGKPPENQHVSAVENLIDDEQWLEDRFVILLIPGCTVKLRERLERGRRNSGLVIIDEQIMRRMVLAEREQRRAVGMLRSLMINAQNAANTDVFRVGKAVEPKTGIFVGREDLIRQVVDGTNNLAIYGGRRIGKSSILSVAFDRLRQRENTLVAQHSFQGGRSVWRDDDVAREFARMLELGDVSDLQTFSVALENRLAADPALRIVLLMDEMDRYIKGYPDRHLLIETLRSLSDRLGDRLRIVVAGFISLYRCLTGEGPYPKADDPWGRMFRHSGPVPNLRPEHAEEIVREGFWEVLGWRFESSVIPQLVVERTGGHPDFVQHFCMKLQERVAVRGDQVIRVDDIKAVFADDDPTYSFIAHVRETLEYNLDPVARLLILLVADQTKESRVLTIEQFESVSHLCRVEIPYHYIEHSLQLLKVTSVISEFKQSLYEFSVPDYPLILSRLEEKRHLAEIEEDVAKWVKA